jgi:hypothetical protein
VVQEAWKVPACELHATATDRLVVGHYQSAMLLQDSTYAQKGCPYHLGFKTTQGNTLLLNTCFFVCRQ